MVVENNVSCEGVSEKVRHTAGCQEAITKASD